MPDSKDTLSQEDEFFLSVAEANRTVGRENSAGG